VKYTPSEGTIKDQETQLMNLEEDGLDIQGDANSYLSDDGDFEEDEYTDQEDYEFLEEDFIPVPTIDEPVVPDLQFLH
jgi:hypothetical protein